MKKLIGILAVVLMVSGFSPNAHAKLSYNGSIYSFAVLGGDIFAASLGGGVFRSNDSGVSWTSVNTGLANMNVLTLKVVGTYILAGTLNDGVYRSTDNGASWAPSGLQGRYVDIFYAGSNYILAGSDSGSIFRSTDNGTSWSLSSTGLTPHDNGDYVVSTFTNTDNHLLTGTIWGPFLSSDNGSSWSAVSTGLNRLDIRAIVANGNDIFTATFGNGVVHFTSNGSTWNEVSASLTNDNVEALIAYNNNFFAGTNESGVLLSTDNGANWNIIGLQYTNINTLAIIGDYLFAGNDTGIWRMPLSGITAVNENPATSPAQFSLLQNYPNPFSGMTNFEYGISNEEHVTLKIYNALGEEVATLVNGETAAGEHSATFNAYNLQNGIYFYKLTAG
ncbi:MAG TPA: T9SS type A sorting domain-containing protein, partial [Candidatus Kapabacteria bacterium]|nr:T9SS type A sorting domain-containing protein [Candidatus Kapabacteria bacterium]